MNEIYYVVSCHLYRTKRYYCACSDKTKSLIGPKLSEAEIFKTYKSAQKIVAVLPIKWLSKPCKITGKKLFHARLKDI